MTAEHYIGNELELFDKAKNWKAYYGAMLQPYLKGEVMEVGAGIGATTAHLCSDQRKWICLEPDAALALHIEAKIKNGILPDCCELRKGILKDQPAGETYDSIIYIDVIEHIEDDGAELKEAYRRLNPGGYLIILVPAHQWLYSPFDKVIGHYRRYNKQRLLQVVPQGLNRKHLPYLDSVGLGASIANKLFLKQTYPTQKQVLFWDKWMVPISKFTDPLSAYMVGKSLLGIWQKK